MRTYRQIEIFSGITRNIFIMGLVSLFTDLSSQMVFPLIPLFLTTVLGCGAYVVGIVEGAAETTASLLKVVSGYWSDKINKRKPFILFGYSMSSITKPLFALANIWTFVLFLRVIERIGKGIRTAPRDALVAESCDESVRGKAFGFHRAADGIGSILGAVLALLLLPVWGYRNIFLFALVPGVISVFIILFIQEKKCAGKTRDKRSVCETEFKRTAREFKILYYCLFSICSGAFRLCFSFVKGKEHRIGR